LIVSRPPEFPVEDKLRIVLSVLSGGMTIAEAARRNKTSEQATGRWKQQFIEAGRAGPARPAGGQPARAGACCPSFEMSA
jgi:transposase